MDNRHILSMWFELRWWLTVQKELGLSEVVFSQICQKVPVLAIVVPCYNEEAVLPVTSGLFERELDHLIDSGRVDPKSFILFVNDGSRDATWEIIQRLAADCPHIKGISLSRNRGHQNALLGGLMEVRRLCDVSISIDCDGQDDISAMDKMVDAYLEGCDVVYGVRSSRKTDTVFKRVSAQAFYRFLESMGVDTIYNHADYRLLSARVLGELAQFHEVNLFLRGMIPLIGFKSTSVYYERHERMAGESHYPLRKMIGLAMDGITSLSTKPIRIISLFGLIVAASGFLAIIWALATALAGLSVAGWASTLAIICFMGGVQLLSVGIIGEYVGKIYMETKHRPRFIISERTWAEGCEKSNTDSTDL